MDDDWKIALFFIAITVVALSIAIPSSIKNEKMNLARDERVMDPKRAFHVPTIVNGDMVYDNLYRLKRIEMVGAEKKPAYSNGTGHVIRDTVFVDGKPVQVNVYELSEQKVMYSKFKLKYQETGR